MVDGEKCFIRTYCIFLQVDLLSKRQKVFYEIYFENCFATHNCFTNKDANCKLSAAEFKFEIIFQTKLSAFCLNAHH